MGFFNLSKALEEVSDAFGAKETAIASAKLLGKGVVNLAHFAATTGLDSVVKQTWIESGGRDEDYSYYYEKWHRRTQR
ncbi:hypothetical protein [Klebsiella pneumoniae]|uniref:hypothetical protein n=1 Tax=Klebsiella pneumoniae TaxID=573 RepID=UPI000DF3D69C|nr:hypothetical protein [Klebsiella pneumoniae]